MHIEQNSKKFVHISSAKSRCFFLYIFSLCLNMTSLIISCNIKLIKRVGKRKFKLFKRNI